MFDTSTLKSEQNKDNRAVSPVIGVILMVAITVILAAVIGTFVLDLGSDVEQNANAGIVIDEANDGDVTFTLVSMNNAEEVEIRGVPSEETLDSVGKSITVSGLEEQVTFVAISPSGEETVVQTYTPDDDGGGETE